MPVKDKAKQRAYWNKWRKNHKKTFSDSKDKRYQKIKNWYDSYKTKIKCSRCSERHPACLQFHHRDPKIKDLEISKMVNQGFGIARIKKEMLKCDVLCANCHAKEHWGQPE